MSKSEYAKARDALLKRIKRLENAGFAVPREKIIPGEKDAGRLTALTRGKILEMSGYSPGTETAKVSSGKTPGVSVSDTEQAYNAAVRRLSKNMRIKIADLKQALPYGKIPVHRLQSMTAREVREQVPSLRTTPRTSPSAKGGETAGEKKRGSARAGKEPGQKPVPDRGDSDFYRYLKTHWKELNANFPEFLARKDEITVRELREYFGSLKPGARESFKSAVSVMMTDRPLRWKDILTEDNMEAVFASWDSVKTLFPEKFMTESRPSASALKRFLKSMRLKEAADFMGEISRRVIGTTGNDYAPEVHGSLPGTPDEYGTYTNFILQRYDELIAAQTMVSFRQAAEEMKSAFLYIVAREGKNAEEYARTHRDSLEEEILSFCPPWVKYKKEQMEDSGLYDSSLFGFTAGGYVFDVF